MSSDPNPERQRREATLVIVFTLFAGLGALFIVLLLTGPLFIYILLTVLGLGALVAVNYLLWGLSMERETAGEREEAELEEQMEEPAWEEPHPRGRHHE